MDLLTLLTEFQNMQREMAHLKEKVSRLESQPLALEWLPETEACVFLHRSKNTVRKLAREGSIRSEKRGGRVLYHVESMRAFLRNDHYSPEYIENTLKSIAA